MGNIFSEITVVICLAALLTVFFQMVKQPAVLAYILTGILLGPLGIFPISNREVIQSMAEIGITLLLFMLGLQLKIQSFKSVGKAILIGAFLQMMLTFAASFGLMVGIGFSLIPSLYCAVALTFSSTIIAVKLLTDKRDINSLYGKITVGILLLQDIFAIFILILLSGFTALETSAFSIPSFIPVIQKGITLFVIIILLSRYVFPKIMDTVAKSAETLFLFSLGWVFGLSAFVTSPIIGFPIEIGGFLAGLALANSSENFQIVSRMTGLRDFFITMFFVILGMGMTFKNGDGLIGYALVLSCFVLIIKPFIVSTILGVMGYSKRTSFLSAITLGQISEFSLIIAFLGNRIGHLPQDIVSILTLVAVITYVVSTYTITQSKALYKRLHQYLLFIEQKTYTEKKQSSENTSDLKDHIVLIGGHSMGKTILDALIEEKENVVVVDFDPDIINAFKKKGILSVFGDISDSEIQSQVNIHKAKHVISTVSDLEDNISLIKALERAEKNVKIVVVARDEQDAEKLYKAGADYVILPHIVGGMHLAKIIKDNNLDKIEKYKAKTPKSL